jgi:ketosteroid isomerase-like protein
VTEPIAIVERYLKAIEDGATGETLAAFFTADAVQEEFPNRLQPMGKRRDMAGILEAAERGQKAMAAQRFEILSVVASGGQVSAEVQWTGTLAVPFGTLARGDKMRARIAMFLEIRDGRIALQRNYDCYDPF